MLIFIHFVAISHRVIQLTLTCAFNSVTNSDCLAVVEALFFLYSSLFVGVVLEMRHDNGEVGSIRGVLDEMTEMEN